MRAILALMFTLLVLAGLASGGYSYYVKYTVANEPKFRTTEVLQGDLAPTISATGTVEPEEVIDVGAQVTGRIDNFGDDPAKPGKTIDFGTVVHKDMFLAQLDQTSYKAQVVQAEAALQSSEANLLQLTAKLAQTKAEWERAESLIGQDAVAKTDYDTALANYKVAEANIAVGKATIKQNQASLDVARVNLGYTTINSPVEGTVIARRVNKGQTVSASLSAPSLFLIAKDLRRMEVWAAVNEADIGRIQKNMTARFTVDTFPNETFSGTVTQIRLNASMSSNVVIYTVVVTTDNSSLRLLPYLTANVLFEVDRRENVLMVPNTALRWKPSSESQILPSALKAATDASAAVKKQTRNSVVAQAKKEGDKTTAKKIEVRRLWVIEGQYVKPIDVIIGISDGVQTEIITDELKKGDRVVVGMGTSATVKADSEASTNPFLPKMPSRGKRPPGPPGG